MSICIPAPNVAASGSFLAQTAAISTTTIYTPSASGLFRVNVAGDVSGNPVDFEVTYTSPNSNSGGFSGVLGSAVGSTAAIASGESAIQIYTQLNEGSATYDLFYSVEAIS